MPKAAAVCDSAGFVWTESKIRTIGRNRCVLGWVEKDDYRLTCYYKLAAAIEAIILFRIAMYERLGSISLVAYFGSQALSRILYPLHSFLLR